MSLKDQSTLRIVLCESEPGQPMAVADRFSTVRSLLEKGYAVTRADGQRAVAQLDEHPMLVLGLFGGATPTADAPSAKVRFHDISGLESERIGQVVDAVRDEFQAARQGEW